MLWVSTKRMAILPIETECLYMATVNSSKVLFNINPKSSLLQIKLIFPCPSLREHEEY